MIQRSVSFRKKKITKLISLLVAWFENFESFIQNAINSLHKYIVLWLDP